MLQEQDINDRLKQVELNLRCAADVLRELSYDFAHTQSPNDEKTIAHLGFTMRILADRYSDDVAHIPLLAMTLNLILARQAAK